jgi:hypothetical protein
MALYCSISVYESSGSVKVWEIKNTKVSIAIIKFIAFLDYKNTKKITLDINKEKNGLLEANNT